MKLVLSYILLILPLILRAEPPSLPAALDSLDQAIEQQQRYTDYLCSRIDTLRQRLPQAGSDERLSMLLNIGNLYSRHNIDSAIHYYDMVLASTPDSNAAPYRHAVWAKSTVLPLNGMVSEALDLYRRYRPGEESDSADRALYYDYGVDLYQYLSAYHHLPRYRALYGRKSMELNDSMLMYARGGSSQYLMHQAYRDFAAGERALAAGEISQLLDSLQPTDPMYALAHSILAEYHLGENRQDEGMYHLTLAAIADIKAATNEATALQRLGTILYDRGEKERAFNYLVTSLLRSVDGASSLRTLENAQSLPMISTELLQQHRSSRRIIITLSLLLVLACASAVVLLVLLRRQKYANIALQTRLGDTVGIKDAYIGRVLSMCSYFIERIEDFNRLAGRKIKAGQVKDLMQMIESGKMLQEQATNFYEVFDKEFFGMYPDFISEVNKLLLPDKQIVLPMPGRLTPETRILAFMRLGVDDSTKLSKLLGLSLNTIYTYRNKLRSRAINRENFESKIRKIGN